VVRVGIAGNSWDVESMISEGICRSRRIAKIDVQTPLLVPSFSSVACDMPPEMYVILREHITDASLISAYDLHIHEMAQEDIWASDVLFIDSGNYEIRQIKDFLKQFHKSIVGKPNEWSFQIYSETVDSLKPPQITKVVLVNYDEKMDLAKQISTAHDFFERHRQFAGCFLTKPSDENSNYVDIECLVDNVNLISQFDVLGFTEKELGSSLLDRCTNILKLRKALNSHGSQIPIHVFGCLDPIGIIAYFLCGADIFDGTLWLKYGYHENAALYINNYAVLQHKWASSYLGVNVASWIQNLIDLRNLMFRMRRYAQDNNVGIFELGQPIMKQITELTNTAASSAG
jgi:hypothetical protein